MKEFKPQRFYLQLEDDERNYIFEKGRGDTMTKAMHYFVRVLRGLEGEGLNEIRGYFAHNEWKFLADALKDDPDPIWSKEELIRRVMRIRNMETTASFYNVVPKDLCEKISALNGCHVFAITARVHEFWERSQLVSMDEWAQY